MRPGAEPYPALTVVLPNLPGRCHNGQHHLRRSGTARGRLHHGDHHRRDRRLARREVHPSDMGLLTNIVMGIIGAWSAISWLGNLGIAVYGFLAQPHIGDARGRPRHRDLPGPLVGSRAHRTSLRFAAPFAGLRRRAGGLKSGCGGGPRRRRFPTVIRMAVVLDPPEERCPSTPSREGASAGPAGPAQARLDSGQGARLAEVGRDPAIVRENEPRHGVRGGGLPQYRRVLGEEARHFHDHGRHLHPGLRLLQRRDGPAAARSIRTSPRSVAKAVAKLGLAHVVITSVDRDDLRGRRRGAFRAGDPGDPRVLAGNDHRGADTGFPAKGRGLGDRRSRQARRLQPQPRDRAVEIPHRAARRALLPFHSSAPARERTRSRRSSPSPASWSASARSGTRCCS